MNWTQDALLTMDPLVVYRPRSRRYERENPARRYLVPKEIRDQIVALTESMAVRRVDDIATALLDFALAADRKGTLPIHSEPEYIGVLWSTGKEMQDGAYREIPARLPRVKKYTPGAAYRTGAARHQKLWEQAQHHRVSLSYLVTTYLKFGLNAYRTGALRLDVHYVAVKEVAGWYEGTANGE
jgi:hypothetical protein